MLIPDEMRDKYEKTEICNKMKRTKMKRTKGDDNNVLL